MHIFKMNEFFRGISLPQPEIVEPLENKLPKQALSTPHLLDFLKVIYILINHSIFNIHITKQLNIYSNLYYFSQSDVPRKRPIKTMDMRSAFTTPVFRQFLI